MKISPRICRHCGSPAKQNPCWWGVRHTDWNRNYDPPCIEDYYIAFQNTQNRRWSLWFWSVIVVLLAVSIAGLYYG